MANSIPNTLERQFLGTWKTVHTEGMEQLREVFNLDADTVPDNPQCEIRICKDGETAYNITNTSTWGTETLMSMELGKPAKHTILGREMDLVMAWEGHRLTIREVGSQTPMVTREIVEGKLVSVAHINHFVIKTVAEKC